MARDKRPTLSHLAADGTARMVDVGDKAVTSRTAVAEGRVRMKRGTFNLMLKGQAKKGDVLGTARLAGIMGAKRTHELIPLCHPLALSHVQVDLTPRPSLPGVEIVASVRTEGRTGVEMEALTAVTCAALCVYDMLKAVDREMVIEGINLLEKHGGVSGSYRRGKS
ncbi:MAG: cyclic pyranopterin monophosphate synthase MoaC [Myxococcota bacterium]